MNVVNSPRIKDIKENRILLQQIVKIQLLLIKNKLVEWGVGLTRSLAALSQEKRKCSSTKFCGVLIGPERTLPHSFSKYKGAAKSRNNQLYNRSVIVINLDTHSVIT